MSSESVLFNSIFFSSPTAATNFVGADQQFKSLISRSKSRFEIRRGVSNIFYTRVRYLRTMGYEGRYRPWDNVLYSCKV